MLNLEILKRDLSSLLGFSPKEPNIQIGRIAGSFFQNEKLTDSELNHHVHIVGASGFGKTVLLTKIMKSRLTRGQGLLWIDLKGDVDTIQEMIKTVKESGRGKDLKIFSISHPELTGSYNLLQNGDATELRDKLMGSFEWSNEFYKDQAASYLLKLFMGLTWLREHQQYRFDLATVLESITNPEFVEELCLKIPESALQIKRLMEDLYSYINNKTSYENLSGLRAHLESLVLSNFGKFLKESPDGINLFQAVKNQQVAFIFLDSRRYKATAKAIGRLIVQDIIATSARIDAEIPKSKRKPFVCFIDEFADLATPDFISFPDRARSSKMSLVLSHQEIADLKAVDENFATRLTANMATLYAFLQSNPDSAEAIASRGGTKSVLRATEKTKRMLFWDVPTGEKSLRQTEEFNIHPNTIKSLGVGECVVIKKYPRAVAYKVRVNPEV
ncbi:type IV secretory system conjugative DNA transfer family protein [Bdellovibrio svalbardensis]|uniref:TraM recognition domain-containing protein n=1 Tax=Bdellovibrio svalbardensis TaxID=2972972 RepID=A0ABT6DI11_9BACT|nr:TraM recognition domain-containing protein [Bdellovibrio svalbardensis]MDG0816426.1 TraM recognition domain-containing protein [Bdellovibrio svalbardensis]